MLVTKIFRAVWHLVLFAIVFRIAEAIAVWKGGSIGVKVALPWLDVKADEYLAQYGVFIAASAVGITILVLLSAYIQASRAREEH